MLDFAKVAEQFAGQRGELQKAVFQGGVVQQGKVPGLGSGYFGVDVGAALAQFGDTGFRVGFAACADLFEQFEQR